MKRLILPLVMMANILSAPPKSTGMTHDAKLKCLALKEDIGAFIMMEAGQNKLNDRQFIVFMRKQEETIRDLVTRINTLLNTYPDNTIITSFIPSRDHLQELLDTVEAE
jgi:hypothetical protein